jgi:hypothetical protein
VSSEQFAAGVHDVLRSDFATLVGSAAYVETRRRISDSLLALTVLPGSAQDEGLLTRGMRLCGVLDTFAANPDATIDRDKVSLMRVLLPPASHCTFVVRKCFSLSRVSGHHIVTTVFHTFVGHSREISIGDARFQIVNSLPLESLPKPRVSRRGKWTRSHS